MGAEDAEGVVLGLPGEAFGRHDAQLLRQYLTDDVVYHNIPMEPAVGIEATISAIEGFFGMFESMEIETTHIASRGNVVLTERIDTFTLGELVAPLPVMGTFELREGLHLRLARLLRLGPGDGDVVGGCLSARRMGPVSRRRCRLARRPPTSPGRW